MSAIIVDPPHFFPLRFPEMTILFLPYLQIFQKMWKYFEMPVKYIYIYIYMYMFFSSAIMRYNIDDDEKEGREFDRWKIDMFGGKIVLLDEITVITFKLNLVVKLVSPTFLPYQLWPFVFKRGKKKNPPDVQWIAVVSAPPKLC